MSSSIGYKEDYEMYSMDFEKFLRKLESAKQSVLSFVNRNVNKTSQVSSVQVFKAPFEKTANRKIRRFNYLNQVGF